MPELLLHLLQEPDLASYRDDLLSQEITDLCARVHASALHGEHTLHLTQGEAEVAQLADNTQMSNVLSLETSEPTSRAGWRIDQAYLFVKPNRVNIEAAILGYLCYK